MLIALAQAFLNFFLTLVRKAEVHWQVLLALTAALWALILFYRFLVTRFGPADLTGRGITVGDPKVFDNRSLTLMIDALNSSLQSLNAVNPNLTQNLSTFQQAESDSSRKGVQLAAKSPNANSGSPTLPTGDQKTPSAPPLASSQTFGISASDALGDQLNLSYQIFNQRIVNERALSDRLYKGDPRHQVVLGFPISIDPPAGAEDCAAVAEIGLDFTWGKKAGSEGTENHQPEVEDFRDEGQISIVALIPQEKTYNAMSVSSSADSIDGSVVSSVMAIGGTSSRQSDRLYLHRDSDTIAFERERTKESGAFGLREPKEKPPSKIFGWEFHPVLGRRTVTAGTKLMLAVVALPCAHPNTKEKADAGSNAQEPILKVKTRTYWLSYDRKCQTTNVQWAWWPYRRSEERIPKWLEREPPELSSSSDLAPKIEGISWVDTGADAEPVGATSPREDPNQPDKLPDGGGPDRAESANSAVVLVEGQNFFPGTEVIIGGSAYNEKNGLTLKSHRALQVMTTVEAIGKGNAVLNGRYGPSMMLAYPTERNDKDNEYEKQRKEILSRGIKIINVQYVISQGDIHKNNQTRLCLVIGPNNILTPGDIAGSGPFSVHSGEDAKPPSGLTFPPEAAKATVALTASGPEHANLASEHLSSFVKQLLDLPDPIVLVDGKPLPGPYGIETWNSAWEASKEADQNQKEKPTQERDAIRVAVWAPLDSFKTETMVIFKIPFCGPGWTTPTVLQSVESVILKSQLGPQLLRVVRLGSDGSNTQVVVSLPGDLPGIEWKARLDTTYSVERIAPGNFLLSVPSAIMANYSKLIFKSDKATFLIDIPRDTAASIS